MFLAFRKKVEALAKTKECEIVGKWIKSMVNHIYWCAASTPDGDSNMMKCKWLSLDNHLHNVHEGHSSSFPTCLHGPLPEPRRKLWLSPRNQMRKLYKQIYDDINLSDTKASKKVSKIIRNTLFVNDFGKLSPIHQTSSLEAFHSVIIHFTPKSICFSYAGMKSRYITTVLVPIE